MTRSLLSRTLRFTLAAALFAAVVPFHARAQGGCLTGGSGGCPSSVPEVDPSLAAGALTLLSGAVVILRHRRRP